MSLIQTITGTQPDKGKKSQPAKPDPAAAPTAALATPPIEVPEQNIADRIRAEAAQKGMEVPATTTAPNHLRFEKNTVVQLANSLSVGGFRVWLITGIVLGDTGQEDHYRLRPLDQKPGNDADGKPTESLVPCWMLDTHDQVHAV